MIHLRTIKYLNMKKNLLKHRLNCLKKFHFNLINDSAHYLEEIHGLDYKEKLKLEYQNLVQKSHTNMISIKIQKLFFCKKKK